MDYRNANCNLNVVLTSRTIPPKKIKNAILSNTTISSLISTAMISPAWDSPAFSFIDSAAKGVPCLAESLLMGLSRREEVVDAVDDGEEMADRGDTAP